MVLAEGTGREEDVDASNRFADGGFSREPNHRRSEDRVAALGLPVEEESLQSIAESSFDDFGQISENSGRITVSHQDDLDPLIGSLDGELEVAESTAMRAVCIGFDAGLADGLSDFGAGFIDQGMVDGAMRCVDDAMAIRLEETDFRVLGLSSHGESCSMSMAEAGGLVEGRIREIGGVRDRQKPRPGFFWEIGRTESRATRAGRSMGTVVSVRHEVSVAGAVTES